MRNDEDLSQAWTEEEIALSQRRLVEGQLETLRKGNPPKHFGVLGRAIKWFKLDSGLERATLLDAGCASAYYYEIIQYYEPDWIEYTGLDYSQAMVDLAKEKYPEIAIIKRDLRSTGLDARSFDIVLSGAVLMHIRDWREALVELTRVADKWLILHRTWVFIDDTPTTIRIGDAYGHPVWYIRFNEKELLGFVEQEGFFLVTERLSGEGGEGPNQPVKTYVFKREASG